MQTITTFLWFNTEAEQAANLYFSIFPNSKILEIARYGDSGPGPAGSVMTVRFVLNGQEFIGLNGGPRFQFTEAVSFSVNCRTQDEIDHYWSKLTEGGQPGPCGWLKDRFGLSWQVNPVVLGQMLSDPDRAKAQRVTEAMLQMSKMDIAALERAAAGSQ